MIAVDVASVAISVLEPGHWPEVAHVYAEGIATGKDVRDGGSDWDRWDAGRRSSRID